MKLGMMVIPPTDVGELARKVNKLGLEALELALPISLERPSDDYRAHLSELVAAIGVEYSFHQPLLNILSTDDAGLRRLVMELMRGHIELASSLGGGVMTVHSALTRTIRPRSGEWRNADTRWFVEIFDTKLTDDFERTVEDTTAALAELGPFAASRGVRLALENNFRDEVFFGRRIESVGDVASIAGKVGLENVGVCLDVFKAYTTEPSLADGIRSARGLILDAHVSDIADARDAWAWRRGAVGSGLIDWDGALAALADAGYDGPLQLEMIRGDDEQEQSCAFLRAALGRLGRNR